MADENQLLRHSSYFRGWYQAFGEHQSIADEYDIFWLCSSDQIGVILPLVLARELLPESQHVRPSPLLSVGTEQLQIGAFAYTPAAEEAIGALQQLYKLLRSEERTNIFLTSHFKYGSGPKIVTFSKKRPLSIIYKEIGPMRVRLI